MKRKKKKTRHGGTGVGQGVVFDVGRNFCPAFLVFGNRTPNKWTFVHFWKRKIVRKKKEKEKSKEKKRKMAGRKGEVDLEEISIEGEISTQSQEVKELFATLKEKLPGFLSLVRAGEYPGVRVIARGGLLEPPVECFSGPGAASNRKAAGLDSDSEDDSQDDSSCSDTEDERKADEKPKNERAAAGLDSDSEDDSEDDSQDDSSCSDTEDVVVPERKRKTDEKLKNEPANKVARRDSLPSLEPVVKDEPKDA
jgi:hypothetical protein